MSTEPQRTCPSCGNEFSGAMEFCPVCLLRKGLAGGVESGESSFEEAVKPTLDQQPKRFEHYELPILWFVNTLANSSGVSKPGRGRNAIGGSFIIIKHLRRSCRIILRRWSHSS